MSLVAITCTKCGSSDIQEVKPNTFFCNYCDTVFKHVDPTRLTIQREFCECGGAIAFQCRVCRTGICKAHDAWPPMMRRSGPDLFIPTPLPVYRLGEEMAQTLPKSWHSEYYVRTYGALNAGLILDQFSGGELHLCAACLEEMVMRLTPAAAHYADFAKLKIAGNICAHPDCISSGDYQCPCCRFKYCTDHCGEHYFVCGSCADLEQVITNQAREAIGFTVLVEENLRAATSWVDPYKKPRAARRSAKAYNKLSQLRGALQLETARRMAVAGDAPCPHATADGLVMRAAHVVTAPWQGAWSLGNAEYVVYAAWVPR